MTDEERMSLYNLLSCVQKLSYEKSTCPESPGKCLILNVGDVGIEPTTPCL